MAGLLYCVISFSCFCSAVTWAISLVAVGLTEYEQEVRLTQHMSSV